jgi:hypothetical protein
LILWFAGGACLLVWLVLHDPRLDYRVLVGGALLPELLGVRAHSVLVPVVLMVAVMAMTAGDRDRRRRWLALPIGVFAHLVLDAVWSNTSVFWWPLSGWSLAGERLPSLARPVWVVVAQEVAGLAALVWVHGRVVAEVDAGDVPTC